MPEDAAVEISVIVPALNESTVIEYTIVRIADYFKGKNLEIIVVDDGSSDQTAVLVRNMTGRYPVKLLQNQIRSGKGAAVRKGIMAAKGELVLFSDADLSCPIEEFAKLKSYYDQGYEMVFGSRRARGTDITKKQPAYRLFLGWVFHLLFKILINPDVEDSQCGFKMFRKSVAQKLFQNQAMPGFGFDIEVFFLARKMNLKIKEVPVVWRNRVDSRLHPVKDSLVMFFDLFRARFCCHAN